MKFFTSAQISEIDKYTIINEPISSIDLMERAAVSISDWLINKFVPDTFFRIFAGPGNNGGDASAVARILAIKGYKVALYIVKTGKNLSPDAETNLQRFIDTVPGKMTYIEKISDFPEIKSEDIIIDGLFGSGLNRTLTGISAKIVSKINKTGAEIISIDIPSGLFGEDNKDNDHGCIIKANQTLSLQFPKLSFLFAENYNFVGDFEILPIGLSKEIINLTPSPYYYVDKEIIKSIYVKRKKYSHKGSYGHALIIAGSNEKTGAAILASKACLRSGVGLLTAHIPVKSGPALQSLLPESMISFDKSEEIITELPELSKYSAIGVGPGLGLEKETKNAVKKLIINSNVPLVIDADALNIISEEKNLLNKVTENSILTPHIKEFSRLFGSFNDSYERINAQIKYSIKHKIIIVLKGANTSISTPDGNCFFNSTGNPGMATGGSGDVLTGIILSLLSQGYKPVESAIFGVYLHGLAGDIASNCLSEESLIASDITNFLGSAFKLINKYE
ncbi:MAG: NAD(P)H-hydrate dehydratase [Bacteroidota bacterium]